MDETLLGWIFLKGLMLFWRAFSRCHCVQRLLHACGGIAAFFQWYVLTLAGLVLLLARTMWDIIIYDYIGYRFLNTEKVDGKISTICEGFLKSSADSAACQSLRDELKIPPWLHAGSLLAPIFGILGFVVLAKCLWSFVELNRTVAQGTNQEVRVEAMEAEATPWKLAPRLEWVIIILGTPLIFIVMSMRSLIRIWTVMTGSAYHPGADWDEVVRLELATYQMDLELGVAFQFYACLMFGLLCTSFLRHSEMVVARSDGSTHGSLEEYMTPVAYASVQGVYAFVFIGVLRTVFDITVTYLSEMPEYHEKAELIQNQVLSKVATIFSFVTLLCMLNMVLISKVPDIERGLRNANPKFLGVRLLLLITQIQPQVLQGITVGSPLYKTLNENAKKLHIEEMFAKWTFTPKQALLAHAAALNYECLLVAILTYCMWRLRPEQKKALMTTPGGSSAVARAREISPDGYRKLLDA